MVHFVICREKQEAAFAAQEAWARRFEEVLIIQGQDLCVEAYEGFLRTGSKGAVLVSLILIAFSVLTYSGRLSEKAGLGECTITRHVCHSCLTNIQSTSQCTHSTSNCPPL